MSVRLITHQFGQFISAFKQLFQTLHQVCVWIEINPVGNLSHLTMWEKWKLMSKTYKKQRRLNTSFLKIPKNVWTLHPMLYIYRVDLNRHTTSLHVLIGQEHTLLVNIEKCDKTQRGVPSRRVNLHVILRPGWSSPRFQNEWGDVPGLQFSQFCWACVNPPGTHCSDLKASHGELLPLFSAERTNITQFNRRLMDIVH